MAHRGTPGGVVVTDHAIKRLRSRIGRTRRWTYRQCELWIADAATTARVVIHRANGEDYLLAKLFERSLYLAVLPSADGSTCLVRTVLPFAFALSNLTRRSP